LRIHPFQIFLPFHGQQVFFTAVAFLAAGDHVVAAGFAAAGNRYDMIHGQLIGGEAAVAVVTTPLGQPVLPPAALAQLPGFSRSRRISASDTSIMKLSIPVVLDKQKESKVNNRWIKAHSCHNLVIRCKNGWQPLLFDSVLMHCSFQVKRFLYPFRP